MPIPQYHQTLVDGFHAIADKNALGWAVLDCKSELLVTAAIATAINRRAGDRIAHVEFPPARTDLVILEERLASRPRRPLRHRGFAPKIAMTYEAKAGHYFDFDARHIRPKNDYLGRHLGDDMEGLLVGTGAGLFFMSEVADATRHLKYFAGEANDVDDAVSVLCRHVTRGTLVAREVMDCGVADGTNVKIHMCVFDPN